jgi:RNA polymerase sigma-32 factor
VDLGVSITTQRAEATNERRITMHDRQSQSALPILSHDGLGRYMTQIRKFPMLSPEKEDLLAKQYRDDDDAEAAAQLVTSHLRLVAKIAMGFRGYGLPLCDLISEGNIGLMRGVKLFDPDRGFRLSTYATWWIKASLREFVLRNWSLVKIGTTAAQKKLFYNLNRMKARIGALGDRDLRPKEVRHIATSLRVPEADVISMDRRMQPGGDASLNTVLRGDGETQWQDIISDEQPLQEQVLADAEEVAIRHDLLSVALDGLQQRERHILTDRRLTDKPSDLRKLSEIYGVSSERIRQIEVRAFEKVQKVVLQLASERQLLLA